MKKTKLMAAIAATTMAVASMAATSVSVSASDFYKDHYDTYRVYVDLKPASGMQQSYVIIGYKRYWFKTDSVVQGNVSGNIRNYGSAGDFWITGVHFFDATSDLTDGGTLYRINFCTDYNTTNFWDIAEVSTNQTKNAAGNLIEPNPVTISSVLVGDLNKDTIVDWQDVTLLSNHLSGSKVLTGDPLRSADTNNDGYVTYADLNLLIDYTSGTIKNFLMDA